MHELPVTESILEIALRHAEQAGATRVTDLYLVVGQLSSIVDDSIQFYWDIIGQGTLCEGAKLHFERVPATLLCLNCGQEYTLSGPLTACPLCDSNHVQVTGGDEFQLASIEVVTEDEEKGEPGDKK